MSRKRFILYLTLVLALLSVTPSTFAQVGESPLLELLALVPDAPHGDIYYNDFRAIEAAYPPAQLPADWAEFESLNGSTAADLFPLDVWWRVFLNYQAPTFQNSFLRSGDMPSAMGIDPFQIDRSLFNSLPPQTVIYLQGNFDVDAVRSALTERDFSQQSDASVVELWCGEVGCENSDQANMSDRYPADLFGGELGRQWARIISPNLLVGSNLFEDMQAVVNTAAGKDPSLADNSRYQAAVDAVSGQGVLLQALIVSESSVEAFGDPALLAPNLPAGFEPLPAFDLLMLADVVSESEQIANVVLVYASQADAEQAAAILPARIEAYQSLAVNRPWRELLTDRRVDEINVEVISTTDQFVVRLTFATPKAAPEEIIQFGPTLSGTDLPDVTPPGLVYRLLMDGYFRRDLGWLTTAAPE